MSILNVNTIQPIGSGTTVTVAATELKTSNFITVGTGASVTSPSANVLTLGTNNAERLRITSAGLIGIGTANPGETLHLTTTSGNCKLRIDAASAASVEFYNSGTRFSDMFTDAGTGNFTITNRQNADIIVRTNGSNERVYVKSSGEVSIGGFTPSAGAGILQISGGLRVAGSASASDTTSPYIYRTPNYDHLNFATNGSERLRITSAGKVGINESNPDQALHVKSADGDTVPARIESTGSQSRLGFQASGSANSYNVSCGAEANNFIVHTNNVERLRVDSSGRVLIGTESEGAFASNAGAKLQVRATSDAPRILFGRNDTTATTGESLGILGWYGNDGGSYQECARIAAVVDSSHANNDKPTRISFYVCRDNSGSISESWRLRSDGGTQNFSTSTNYDLSNTRSAGSTYEFIYARNNSGSMGAGTLAFRVTNNGNVTNTNNSYGSLSDQRLKENIVDATSQWDDIKGLQIRKYNFRENTGYETHTQIGLIAQEAESVSAGLVETSAVREGETVLDADGNQLDSIKSINYSVLYMKAVKALQEAQTRIETLESQHADLLARVTVLEGS